jgi:hypothetical protein
LEINDQKLTLFDGNYDDYKNKDKIEEVIEAPKLQVKQTKVRKGGKW